MFSNLELFKVADSNLKLPKAPIKDSDEIELEGYVSAAFIGATNLSDFVVEVTLDSTELDYTFKPLDSIKVLPSNSNEVIKSILAKLPHSDDSNVEDLTKSLLYVDITTLPKKAFIRLLGDFCEHRDRDLLYLLSSIEGKPLYDSLRLQYPTLLDFLDHFTTCKIPLELLISKWPRIRPRFYSLSRLVDNQAVFAFNISGLCTKYLAAKPSSVLIQMGNSHSPNLNGQILALANGTGVAPFVGLKTKPIILLYGHRNKDDAIYSSEFGDMDVKECLSRQGGGYIQESIQEKWISRTILVCGSAVMGRDVHTKLLQYKTEDGMTFEEAVQYWKEREKDGTYWKEVWG